MELFFPPDFFGNAATLYFSLFTLIAGVVGLASVFSGIHLARDQRDDLSTASISTSAMIAWALLLIAFG